MSIVVQLAATRYTSRIADMFFRDRTNLAIMGFFVVACIDAVWLSLAVSGKYVPRATVVMTLIMVTGSLLVLVPYFAHVFDFLDPEDRDSKVNLELLLKTQEERKQKQQAGQPQEQKQKQEGKDEQKQQEGKEEQKERPPPGYGTPTTP